MRFESSTFEVLELQLSVKDIFPSGWPTFEKPETDASHQESLKSAKYADGPGRTWTGLGRKPTWLNEAIAAGAELDDFLVKGGQTSASRGRPKTRQDVAPQVAESGKIYRCPDGTEWHGRGRRPQALTEALNAGANLADFIAWKTAASKKKR